MFPIFLIFLCVCVFEFTGEIGFVQPSSHLPFMFVLFSLVLQHLCDFRVTDFQL